MAATSATHRHQKPIHTAPPRRKAGSKDETPRRRLLVLAGAVAMLAAVGMAAFVLRPGSKGAPAPTPDAFAEQLESAARAGGGTIPHVFGGTIRSERNGNTLALVADNVPPAACVSVGWKLVRRGLLSINGTMPLRVSAAKLSDLCYQEESGAVLTWIPKQVE